MQIVNELFEDLKKRLTTARDTLATKEQLLALRDEINQVEKDSLVTGDELGVLENLYWQCFGKLNAAAIGEQKPSVICR